MRLRGLPIHVLLLLAAGWLCASPAAAQEQGKPDVVRVNTTLVQTDAMVFDKQGSFVDGLTREQFVLKVNGKPRDISFFERVVAGSRNEEAQLAAARGNTISGNRLVNTGVVPLDRGRTVFFFVDDTHLSIASMKHTKTLLQRFIDRDMGQNDEAAIASTSGQIGFLQQLTDDKKVLQAATDRLQFRSLSTKDSQLPPMTEYQAQLIMAENYDVLEFFIDELMRISYQLPRNLAASEIRGRASQIAQQTGYLTGVTLNSLKSLVKNAAKLPGRKLIFLVSDGFLLDNKNSDSYDQLHQITSAAATSGVIIYSIDARGLTTGMPEASAQQPFDPSGRLASSTLGELGASQNGLNALAVDTGGRAFFNSNNLSAGVTTAMKESSNYYLLAWRPEGDEQRAPRPPRIEVSVNGRPELVVRFRRGFGEFAVSESASAGNKQSKPPGELMRGAITGAYPTRDLPVAVSLNFLDLAQQGGTLTAAIKVSTRSLVFEKEGNQTAGILDLGGAVYTDQGKPLCSFNKRLTIRPNSGDAKASPPDSVFYNHFCALKPGLYQVRVGAVDAKQLRVGSASSWIEIPDLGLKKLTLSSLIVGERKVESGASETLDASEPGKAPDALSRVTLNVDHHFSRSSRLRFVTFVYNAGASGAAASSSISTGTNSLPAVSTTGPASPYDLAVQVQVFRDDEPVITTPLRKIQFEEVTDPARLPYAAEVALDSLTPGRYVLLVTIIDRLAKASASQRFGFQID